MDAHSSDSVERERLEVALARAIVDGATVVFLSPPLLLRQVPETLRPAVRAAMGRHQPFVNGATFYVAHIRIDDVPDGRWLWPDAPARRRGMGSSSPAIRPATMGPFDRCVPCSRRDRTTVR